MNEATVKEALNDALRNRAAARSRPVEPVTTDELDAQRLGVLGRTCPALPSRERC